MIATLNYVKRKFAEYNGLMFEGKLEPLPFKLSSARSFLGQIRYRKEQQADGKWHFYDFEFVISNKMDLEEKVIEDTILHEMIHYYIRTNQIQELASHGPTFIRVMKDINVRFNRNISVSHTYTKEEHDGDTEIRQHLICVIRMRNNQRGIVVSAKSRLFQFWDEIQGVRDVEEHKWYVTTDSYFNRFPRATTLKIYSVQSAELEEHLNGALPLERTGNTIKVRKDKM